MKRIITLFLFMLIFPVLPLTAVDMPDGDEPTRDEAPGADEGDAATESQREREGRGEESDEPKLTVDDIPTCITSAQVGDWALYRTAEGGTVRLTVVEKVDEIYDQYLVIQSEERRSDRKKRANVTNSRISVGDSVAELRDIGSEDYIVPAEVLVQGRKLKTVVVNFVNDDGNLWKQSYFSDRVPIHGLVRGVIINGNNREVSLSLQDFGFGDDE